MRALLLALAWGLFVAPAHAATPLQAELDALQAYEEARLALAAGKLDEAELLLERVLMLMPEHAEARLEFALVLARRNQPDAARALILGLVQDARTPAAYRQQLLALADRLTFAPGPGRAPIALNAGPAAGAGIQGTAGNPPGPGVERLDLRPDLRSLWRAEAALSASTNPLARTGAEGIVITLPDGPVTLPLSTRPEAATVAGATVQRVQGSGGVEVLVQHMDRADAATAFRATVWGEWPWGPLPPHLAGSGALQWQLQTLRGFDNLRRHTATLAAPLPTGWLGGAQRVLFSAYTEPYQQDRGWQLRAEHRLGPPSGAQGLTWQASAERSASTTRAQGYWRMNLTLEAPLGPGRRLQLQVTAQEDTHPYSPLLQSNSRRRLLTSYAGLEQQILLRNSNILVIRGFSSQRASNISLFAYRDTGLQLALARQW